MLHRIPHSTVGDVLQTSSLLPSDTNLLSFLSQSSDLVSNTRFMSHTTHTAINPSLKTVLTYHSPHSHYVASSKLNVAHREWMLANALRHLSLSSPSQCALGAYVRGLQLGVSFNHSMQVVNQSAAVQTDPSLPSLLSLSVSATEVTTEKPHVAETDVEYQKNNVEATSINAQPITPLQNFNTSISTESVTEVVVDIEVSPPHIITPISADHSGMVIDLPDITTPISPPQPTSPIPAEYDTTITDPPAISTPTPTSIPIPPSTSNPIPLPTSIPNPPPPPPPPKPKPHKKANLFIPKPKPYSPNTQTTKAPSSHNLRLSAQINNWTSRERAPSPGGGRVPKIQKRRPHVFNTDRIAKAPIVQYNSKNVHTHGAVSESLVESIARFMDARMKVLGLEIGTIDYQQALSVFEKVAQETWRSVDLVHGSMHMINIQKIKVSHDSQFVNNTTTNRKTDNVDNGGGSMRKEELGDAVRRLAMCERDEFWGEHARRVQDKAQEIDQVWRERVANRS